jgi:acylpyruvate hydrolase
MDHYKIDVGKIICVLGPDDKKSRNRFYIKPQGSIGHDGDELEIGDEIDEMRFSMMLGIAIGEKISGDPRSMMRSILGYGVMIDHHMKYDGDQLLALRDPLNSGLDGFCSISEFIPSKKVGDPYALEAYLQVNDEEQLVMSTRDMEMKIEDALQRISSNMTLFPGDMVGIWIDGIDRPSKPGDLLECGISGISTLGIKIRDRTEDHTLEK